MGYNKLIIIPFYVFEKRTNTMFSVKNLIENGVSVEYWNVSAITHVVELRNEIVEGVEERVFKTKAQFDRYVDENASKEALYIVFMTYAPFTYFCYRALSRNQLDIGYCVSGLLPSPQSHQNSIEHIKGIQKKLFNSKSWESLLYSLLKKTPLLKPLKIQLNTCGLCRVEYKTDKNTLFIPFNSLDYETSRCQEDNLIGEPYIVFLDQMLPNHPDNKIVGYQDLNAELYYAQLNKFFDTIENKYKCKVVIAAHPVAEDYKENNPFGGRNLFFYKTQILTKYSIGVISHYTTAYSYAIIFQKPAIVLISDEMMEKMKRPYEYCLMFSSTLNWPLINIDNLNGDIAFNDVDFALYDKYKYDYVTNKESETCSNAEILYNILRQF